MLLFFQENAAAFAGMIVMAIYWFALSFHSVNGNIKNMDKKRADKGITPMTKDEKQIVKSTMRLSVVYDSLGAIVGGIVALVVTYILIS